MSNTINIGDVQVYLNQIWLLADEYISNELQGKEEDVHDNFLAMIFYIRDHMERPGTDDIQLLDKMFGVYVRLCVKYKINPSLEGFSFLTGIHRSTFSDWSSQQYRKSTTYGYTVKTWFDICKSFVVEKLHNSEKVNVNLIFTAKSAYQIREAGPIPAEDYSNGLPQLSREQIADRYREFSEAPEKLELDN